MELDSVRELKLALRQSVVVPAASRATAGLYSIAAQPVGRVPSPRSRALALGISRKKAKDFVLAVRIQQRMLENGSEVERIRKRAWGEIEVRYIGKVGKCAIPWYRQHTRPLRIGSSAAHFRITAGTIGCLVSSSQPDENTLMILSNNHVLADENRAQKGDVILQPASTDNGKIPEDTVGRLERFVRLQKTAPNRMDCAVAALGKDIEYSGNITAVGRVAGVDQSGFYEGKLVSKIGRTTGVTAGRITAFEMDDMVIGFDLGNLQFDNVIEIEGAEDEPFAQGGDSGSLVTNAAKEAVGLVFATSDLGGTNGKGLTYVNPLSPILEKLQVKLLY